MKKFILFLLLLLLFAPAAGAQEPTATPAPAWCCQCTQCGSGGCIPRIAQWVSSEDECIALCAGYTGMGFYEFRVPCGTRCIKEMCFPHYLPLILK